MVSINFQTSGLPMQLYDSFFDQNYNSGFVAKPKMLCEQLDKNQEFSAFKLEIQVISAQFISLLTSKLQKQMGRIQIQFDLYDLPHSLSVNRWEVISKRPSAGFNILFERNMIVFDNVSFYCRKGKYHRLQIITPEIAMLHIKLIDDWGNKIGQRFIHINGIKPGENRF